MRAAGTWITWYDLFHHATIFTWVFESSTFLNISLVLSLGMLGGLLNTFKCTLKSKACGVEKHLCIPMPHLNLFWNQKLSLPLSQPQQTKGSRKCHHQKSSYFFLQLIHPGGDLEERHKGDLRKLKAGGQNWKTGVSETEFREQLLCPWPSTSLPTLTIYLYLVPLRQSSTRLLSFSDPPCVNDLFLFFASPTFDSYA